MNISWQDKISEFDKLIDEVLRGTGLQFILSFENYENERGTRVLKALREEDVIQVRFMTVGDRVLVHSMLHEASSSRFSEMKDFMANAKKVLAVGLTMSKYIKAENDEISAQNQDILIEQFNTHIFSKYGINIQRNPINIERDERNRKDEATGPNKLGTKKDPSPNLRYLTVIAFLGVSLFAYKIFHQRKQKT
mmetsp:Transcript_9025/g.11983  ORF Transcript_9025/g.11983 Transcript_9025/m.11983 type:complete len:193 (-) Transcript_9025:86-664(-)|eukprot:CAMPEP_0117765218 /NCGR_PEP_ID=MMETSP0947-20121206/19963_1 /TAXON_ID=44440 /ORGANISM="Chattonella subsalsa, Strain CCMP2191" /LENGTH=192 /DNA_ID=CAMNT_0005587795 /DNA_START=26 /DNA_END=604 /DNA_ORIENTATION=+